MARLPRLEFLGAFYHVTSRGNARQVIVAEGQGGATPWEQVQGKINLGSEAFVARHQPDRLIAEIPCRQPQTKRPRSPTYFWKGTDRLLISSRRHAAMGIAWSRSPPISGCTMPRSTGESSRPNNVMCENKICPIFPKGG